MVLDDARDFAEPGGAALDRDLREVARPGEGKDVADPEALVRAVDEAAGARR
jgi:hypothetical protein